VPRRYNACSSLHELEAIQDAFICDIEHDIEELREGFEVLFDAIAVELCDHLRGLRDWFVQLDDLSNESGWLNRVNQA